MGSSRVQSLSDAFAGSGNLADLVALCPHCGSKTAFQLIVRGVGGALLHPDDGQEIKHIVTARCRGCRCLVVGAVRDGPTLGVLLWPTESWPDRAPSDLEPDVRKTYDEARAVLCSSPMAAAVLARRCLQQVIRLKLGITKDRLFDEIEEALKRDELTKPTREALHHVREIGNWGAHPVLDQSRALIDVERPEAEYTLRTLELLFHDLYVVPAEAEAMNALIKQKKTGTESPEGT